MRHDDADTWPDPLEDGATHTGGTDTEPATAPADDRSLLGSTGLVLAAAALALGLRLLVALLDTPETRPTMDTIRDWASSGLFFVLAPAAAALLLARRRPASTATGRVMVGVTIGLLLVSMFLGEAAICVLLASPLVYGVAAIVVAIRNRAGERLSSIAVVVLLIPLSQLGASDPVEVVEINRTVDLNRVQIAEHVMAGPRLTGLDRPWLLDLGYPVPVTPEATHDDGDVMWRYDYGNGASVFRMTEQQSGWHFAVVEDTAMRRWFEWHDADLAVVEHHDGTSTVTLTLRFDPALGPDWYFGAIETVIIEAAGNHLLNSLGLEQTGRS